MLTEKYDFRITDQMTIPLRPHWIANDSYREKCKMLVLNRSKGEIHKVDFSKITDYIKEGDVICFNDSTIINHMFICKTRRNRLIKIVLEGFLPNDRVIISGLLKERLNANDVFYLVDNPEISIKVEQKFSEESQYRAVVENHEALICYLASHGEPLPIAKFPWGIQLPSVIGGYPPSTLKIKMVAKISAFTGRAIPVVGWIILASDVSQIAYRTGRDNNRIARGSDKIW